MGISGIHFLQDLGYISLGSRLCSLIAFQFHCLTSLLLWLVFMVWWRVFWCAHCRCCR